MRAYAKEANDIELETAAAKIKLRAQRRIGEISKMLDTAPPGPEPEDSSHRREVTKKRDTLKSAGPGLSSTMFPGSNP